MFRYIDLFCGIGGFHQGIERVSVDMGFKTECVFAADNDPFAANVYKLNYGKECLYDLKKQKTHKMIDNAIGNEELTCVFAGFPCQPFSKAGNQEGFDNKMKGTLYFEIKKIIHRHHPKYVLLENVRNLKRHDNGNTWKIIKKSLEKENYFVDDVILSPNNIKPIPALRERFFILAYNKDKIGTDEKISKIEKNYPKLKTSIFPWGQKERGLNRKYFFRDDKQDIEPENIETINMWNDLLQRLRSNNRYIISPLWPHCFDPDMDLTGIPGWKQKLIKRNQKFYKDNSDIYDKWYSDHKCHFDSLCLSNQKFEWNAGEDLNNIWEGIIQFRPSGVRVKKPDFIPTLVAINQTPILGCEKRYLKPEEMAKLYGFKKLIFGSQNENESKKQLGNTVSVDVVEFLIRHMLLASGESNYEQKNKYKTNK